MIFAVVRGVILIFKVVHCSNLLDRNLREKSEEIIASDTGKVLRMSRSWENV